VILDDFTLNLSTSDSSIDFLVLVDSKSNDFESLFHFV